MKVNCMVNDYRMKPESRDKKYPASPEVVLGVGTLLLVAECEAGEPFGKRGTMVDVEFAPYVATQVRGNAVLIKK